MNRVPFFAALMLIGFSTSLLAAEPVSGKLASRIENLKPVVNLASVEQTTKYELFVAEPVPDLMYRLEYRYTETSYQDGSDWATFSVSEDYDTIQDSILWIALHLVAEWRVTEFVPQPQWESVSIHNSYASAQTASSQWQSLGFITKIVIRYAGYRIDTRELERVFPSGY
ncbi:hypothetical protein SH528x_004239 [Novipirellula sp. SH528]|uniref:hypothetical protein n=1 Tax=Novipirellula sp. SH528 TaxID=3454466 RepID=UPI003FA132DD